MRRALTLFLTMSSAACDSTSPATPSEIVWSVPPDSVVTFGNTSPVGVHVLASDGSPIPNVRVLFAASPTLGSVMAEALTDSTGEVRVNLTAGSVAGTMQVRAEVTPELSVASAVAVAAPCEGQLRIPILFERDGVLAANDCADPDGTWYEQFRANNVPVRWMDIALSAGFLPLMVVGDSITNSAIAWHFPSPSKPSMARMLIGAGTYLIEARNQTAGVGGAYTLVSQDAPAEVRGCWHRDNDRYLWLTSNVQTRQEITADDCGYLDAPNWHWDMFYVAIRPGQRVIIDMTASARSSLVLTDFSGELSRSENAAVAGQTARIDITGEADRLGYIVQAMFVSSADRGQYTISVADLGDTAAGANAARSTAPSVLRSAPGKLRMDTNTMLVPSAAALRRLAERRRSRLP